MGIYRKFGKFHRTSSKSNVTQRTVCEGREGGGWGRRWRSDCAEPSSPTLLGQNIYMHQNFHCRLLVSVQCSVTVAVRAAALICPVLQPAAVSLSDTPHRMVTMEVTLLSLMLSADHVPSTWRSVFDLEPDLTCMLSMSFRECHEAARAAQRGRSALEWSSNYILNSSLSLHESPSFKARWTLSRTDTTAS